MKKILCPFVVLVMLLTACSSAGKTISAASTPRPAGVTLTYEGNDQVELATPTGRHVYVDVFDPSLLLKQPTAEDILLTTHLHTDHYYKSFADAFPGQQILASSGKIDLPDVSITGIASSHNSIDALLDKGGSNYIYLIEIGGIRIIHLGDIGQDALTVGQLDALGRVDIAIMQFDNSFSNMNATNLKGFNLMEQVKPRLIIPSAHVSMATMKIAFERWTGYFTESSTVTITPENLPAKTGVLPLGTLAIAYNNIYHLKPWK